MRRAGLRALQLLPVGTLPAGETSPYSALSAMAIDPVYISLADVPELAGARRRGAAATGGSDRAQECARRVGRAVQRPCARPSRARSDWRSACSGTSTGFARRRARGRLPRTSRGKSGGWATTPSIARCVNGTATVPGPSGRRRSRDRQPEALEEARRELEQEILFHQYVQWIADTQWEAAREQLGEIRLFGDFPFMVSADSADVWANQHAFRFDRTVGTPPDAFSATGQDWGLPVYRWDVMAAEDDRWLRQRARRMARLYDGYRVDHLVGFFRTYSRRAGRDPRRVRSRRRSPSSAGRASASCSCSSAPARRSPRKTSG